MMFVCCLLGFGFVLSCCLCGWICLFINYDYVVVCLLGDLTAVLWALCLLFAFCDACAWVVR